ncbi:putative membrane protein YkoI [Planomicrobium soli]|uniref:Putative membrane protein YkoI n=1 Tax=Planomicrobium soli TaxID=1176648 RepID=A0A2P8FXN4_9BACL|nr:PepSY domain-containing protein [Planomicrobium soli]PSL26478.1 putative membrane protein YkoI [Planomicrobium soli]
MRKKTLMVLATVLLGAVVLVLSLSRQTDSEELTADEAGTKVAEMYKGQVEGIRQVGEFFEVQFVRNDSQYTAEVNRQTGQVTSMVLNQKAEAPSRLTEKEASAIALKQAEGEIGEITYLKESNEFKVEVKGKEKISSVFVAADTGEVRKITNEAVIPEAPSNPRISQEEAIIIAKRTLDGEIAEVEFVNSEDGGYYLIDIENDDTDQEVLVQVHAIRGETMTVEWEN